jgi:glucoamylase
MRGEGQLSNVALAAVAFGLTAALVGCLSTAPLKGPTASAHQLNLQVGLNDFLLQQEKRSWELLQLNISPREPKAPGAPTPRAGIVVAALSKSQPDYYFHWVRDSAHVMSVLAKGLQLQRPQANRAQVLKNFKDFLHLSQHLQNLKSPWGLGEPRYTVTAEVDTLPWSRPQYDGPALRALCVLEYLQAVGRDADPVAEKVLRTDLAYLTQVWNRRGFDIWEEYRADNYQTRLVQLAALRKGAAYLNKPQDAALARQALLVSQQLLPLLDDHWDPARGFLRSQLAIAATDGYTAKKTDLDSAVVVSVVEANLPGKSHSVLDDRVQATVQVLSELFRQNYPINQATDPGLGLAYGRYSGDVYFGGNPWYLITSYFAQFHFRLAQELAKGESFVVTSRNLAFAKDVLQGKVTGTEPKLVVGQKLSVGDPLHSQLIEKLRLVGDSLLRRIQAHTPDDGQLYEQFDKTTGQPTSSRGIGWSHSAFLQAVFERQQLLLK